MQLSKARDLESKIIVGREVMFEHRARYCVVLQLGHTQEDIDVISDKRNSAAWLYRCSEVLRRGHKDRSSARGDTLSE